MLRLPALLLACAALSLPALDVEILFDPATSTPTNGQSATWLVVFSEAVDTATVSTADFTVETAGGNFGAIALSLSEITATSFRVEATWSNAAAEGTVGLRTAAGFAVTPLVGGAVLGLAASGPEVTVDNTPPSLVFINTTGNSAISVFTAIDFQVVFDEAIDPATVAAGDFAVAFAQTGGAAVAGNFFTVSTVTPLAAGVFAVRVSGQLAQVGDLTGTLELVTAAGNAFRVRDAAGNETGTAFADGQAFAVVISAELNNTSIPALVGPRPAEVAVGGDLDFALVVENPVVAGGTLGAFALFGGVAGLTATGVLQGDGTAEVTLRLANVPAQASGYLDFAVSHGGTTMPILIKVTAPGPAKPAAPPAGSN